MAHYLRKHNNVPFSYCLQRGILLSYAALQAFAVRPLGRSLGTLYLSLPRNRVTKPIAASRQSTTTVVVVSNVAQTDVVGEGLCVAGDSVFFWYINSSPEREIVYHILSAPTRRLVWPDHRAGRPARPARPCTSPGSNRSKRECRQQKGGETCRTFCRLHIRFTRHFLPHHTLQR